MAHQPLAVWMALLIYKGSDLVLCGVSVCVKRTHSAFSEADSCNL